MNIRTAIVLVAAIYWASICQAQKPNVILIIADDAGYVDFGFQGSTEIPTPNLDQLAERGVRFSNAYSHSVCAPARAGLLTGQYVGRFGFDQNVVLNTNVIGSGRTRGLSPDQTTVFDQMRSIGYKTSVFGKWHLGAHSDDVENGKLVAPGNRPSQQGVDHFFGLLSGSRCYFVGGVTNEIQRLVTETLDGNGIVQQSVVESLHSGQYVTDVIGNETANHITKTYNDGPFFVCCSFTAPHTPLQALAADLAVIDEMGNGLTGNRRIYAAMQFAMDRAIGNILSRLEDPNSDGDASDSIRDQALVVFINDNGGHCCNSGSNSSSNGILRDGKGSIWEGGIRVPLIMAGAGIAPEVAGSTFESPSHAIDIAATAFGLGGGKANPEDFDGVNLLPFINGELDGDPHEIIYTRYPSRLGLACRSGNFKLYHDNEVGFALLNLATNPKENLKENLINEFPEIADAIKKNATEFDVAFVKRGFYVDNFGVSEFRFREEAFSSANWNTPNAWTNLADHSGDGIAQLQADDGTSDTHLIFRATSNNDYLATNNLPRANGLEFMANQLSFISRPEGLSDSRNATINGLPLILAATRDGIQPRIELESFDESDNFMTFDWQIDTSFYDNVTFSGDGNDVFVFSGALSEYRPNRLIRKTGTSTVRWTGINTFTGTILIDDGILDIATQGAIGVADLVVNRPGKLRTNEDLHILEEQTLQGDGCIEGDLVNHGELHPVVSTSLNALHINGSFNQSKSGCLSVEINSPVEFGKLAVSNDLLLGGTLQINTTTSLPAEVELNLISTDGQIFGEFDTLISDGAVQWNVDYRKSGVWLVSAEVLKGDINQDGMINLLDIVPFIVVVSEQTYLVEADINCDGHVDLLDVGPFVKLLNQGG